MITTRATKRAAAIAAVTVFFVGTAAAAAGGVLPSPFAGSNDGNQVAWRHDGAAVAIAAHHEGGATAVSVASEAPVPATSTLGGVTMLDRARLACEGRDDDESTQATLDLAAAAAAAEVTEDELCALVEDASEAVA